MTQIDTSSRAVIGDNSRARFEALVSGIDATFGMIADRPLDAVKATRAKDISKAALDAFNELERERKDLQRPIEHKLDTIRATFRPWTERLDAIKGDCRTIMTAWLQEERRQAAIKAEEERLALEAARAEAEVLARAAEIDAFAAMDLPEAERQAEIQAAVTHHAEAVAASRPSLAGVTANRASSLRTTWTAALTDPEAAVRHFAAHPDMQALALKLASQAMKASKGTAVIPGAAAVKLETAI